MPNTPSRGHGKKERDRKRNGSSAAPMNSISASPYLRELEETWGDRPFMNENHGDYARELEHRGEVAMRFLDDFFAGKGSSEDPGAPSPSDSDAPLQSRPNSVFADRDVAASLQNPSAETRSQAERAIADLEESRRPQRRGIRGLADALRKPTAQSVAGRVADHIKEHGMPTITPEQADAIHKEEEEIRWRREERERKEGLR